MEVYYYRETFWQKCLWMCESMPVYEAIEHKDHSMMQLDLGVEHFKWEIIQFTLLIRSDSVDLDKRTSKHSNLEVLYIYSHIIFFNLMLHIIDMKSLSLFLSFN